MTTTYSVDPAARIVFTSIFAPLTLGDLIALSEALRKDPSFDPTFDELLKVAPGSAGDFRYADVQAATRTDPFSKRSRRAIVVQAEVDYGVARMYEMMHGGRIQVFRSLEEAREFRGSRPGPADLPKKRLELDFESVPRLFRWVTLCGNTQRPTSCVS